MKMPKLLAGGFLLLYASGCAASDSEYINSTTYGAWQCYSGSCPIEWRIERKVISQPGKYANLTTGDRVQIKNISTKKIQIVGLITQNENQSFIDLNQRGAFQCTLYPEQTTMEPEGETAVGLHSMNEYPQIFLKVQDFVALEN